MGEIARRFESNIWLVRVSLALEYIQSPAGTIGYGSVADSVLGGAHCPTLIVRGPAAE